MDGSSNQTLPHSPLALSPLQRELHDVLASKEGKLSRIYFGALFALNSPANPERFSQCAQSLRELLQKLWHEYDTSLGQRDATLNQKTKELELKWRGIRWNNKTLVSMAQISTERLETFCTQLDEHFEWTNNFVPKRREQASRVIAKMDPMNGKLPTCIMDQRVREYESLRSYFEQVAHHNHHPASDADFTTHVEALERFLLDRLRPRTLESFLNIQRLIQEGESNA